MWWSDAEWQELVDVKRCGTCADAGTDENEHSILAMETDTTWVRLSRNQAHPGYCVVVLREHLTDLTKLSPIQLTHFWEDVRSTGRQRQLDGISLRIDCGTGDGFEPAVQRYRSGFATPPAGGFEPGGHDMGYWRRMAPAHLTHHGHALQI